MTESVHLSNNETAVDPSVDINLRRNNTTPNAPTTQEEHMVSENTQPNDSKRQANLLTKFSMPQFFSQFKKSSTSHKGKPLYTQPWFLIVGGLSTTISVAALILGVYTASIVSDLTGQAQTLQQVGSEAYLDFKSQNLPASQQKLSSLNEKLETFTQTYKKLAIWKAIPFANSYYNDGEHALAAADSGLLAAEKTVAAIVPYADVLGFSGEGSFEGGTAENRVKLMLDTLEKVVPDLDAIAADLKKAEAALNNIDPKRYPEELRGIALRSTIVQGKEAISNATTLLTQYRPILEQLPAIAGSSDTGRKKYLVLFQNDNELRPTGGFLTAYAVIYIENGVVTPEKSDDIYELDKKYRSKEPIPAELGKFLTTERYFNLRDTNTNPDFKASMQKFYEIYSELPGEPDNIDGIIAVDTHVLTSLVKLVGPIQISGYGTFSAENDPSCDCPQIIHALSEIITRPTPYLREDRKGILAPLMQAVLQRIYASPRNYIADLFTVGLEGIEGRHIQMYLFDESQQQAIENINAGGRFPEPTNEHDFFAVVNANLGGAKSNLFIDYNMNHVATPNSTTVEREATITYTNRRRGDNCNLEAGLLCLNATLRDWTRIYLPANTQVDEVLGFLEEPKIYQDKGYTVVEGYFLLEPNGTATLRLSYTIPKPSGDTYSLSIWKQGGLGEVPTTLTVDGEIIEAVIKGDTILSSPY